MISAKKVMLCWKPNSDDVKLVAWPDNVNESAGYRTTLACWNNVRESLPFEEIKKMIFIEFAHLVVRDKIDPMLLHGVLSELEEYRYGCSEDMP